MYKRQVVDFPDFPLLRLVKGVVQGFLEKLLGTHHAAGIAVKVCLYHPGLGSVHHAAFVEKDSG